MSSGRKRISLPHSLCVCDAMSPWDNVDILATTDGEAEPKIEEMEQDKFKVKNYIPQRYHPKYRKYAFIIAGIIIAVIFIILIAVLGTKDSDIQTGTYDALANFRNKLVFLVNETKLLKLDPKTNNSTLIFEANQSVIAFDVHADQRLYWAEKVDNNTTRLKVLANSSFSILIDDARFKPQGMVLDHVSENLYVVDKSAGNLVVLNIRTGDYTLLMSELIWPHEIALDPEQGLMFILQLSTSILRANMDGSDVTQLVSNTGVTSFTLDSKRKRLYWINDFNIESSDYEGKQRQSFVNDIVTMTRLAILDGSLYWFSPGYGYSSSLVSCKIGVNDTCEDYTSVKMPIFGDLNYIKGYSSTHGISLKNPCKVDNGGCQQLCLLSSKNMRSCACRVGWQMNPDKKGCREVRDFLLYPQGGFVRVKSIDGVAKDLIWPTAYKVDSIANKGEIDFDYNLKNDEFYWSDDFHIYRMKLKTFDKQTTILSANVSSMVLEDIAYDWYTGNMYFTQRSKTIRKRHSLMMFNVNLGEKFQKTLYTFGYDMTFGLQACPYAMVLHPAKQSMFFTAGEDDKRVIQHANMIGNTVHRIYGTFPRFVHEYRLIAVDYVKDRIYWIWDSDTVTGLKHSNFDGTDVKFININEIQNAKTIYVHQQWLYISNLTSIWRVHKETGGGAIQIAFDGNRKAIAGVRIISKSVQFIGKENACAENAGCEQFCLNNNGAVCACKDGMRARGTKCL